MGSVGQGRTASGRLDRHRSLRERLVTTYRCVPLPWMMIRDEFDHSWNLLFPGRTPGVGAPGTGSSNGLFSPPGRLDILVDDSFVRGDDRRETVPTVGMVGWLSAQ